MVKACEYINKRGGTVIAFTGSPGGRLREISQKCIVVDTASYEIAEDVHLILAHIIKNYFFATLNERQHKPLGVSSTQHTKKIRTKSKIK